MSWLILAVAPILFIYWFRYTCLLITHARCDQKAASDVAATIRLNYQDVRRSLAVPLRVGALDNLYTLLEDDYITLTELLRPLGGTDGLECKILLVDYKLMRVWYSVCRTAFPDEARRALDEMACILRFFAGDFGQRATE